MVGWTARSWLSTLELSDIITGEILNGNATDPEDTVLRDLCSEADLDAAVDRAVPLIKTRLKKAHRKLFKLKEVDAAKLNERFLADGKLQPFKYGTLETYHGGLEGLLGNPDPDIGKAMEYEHYTAKVLARHYHSLVGTG
jgi:hypothetical protein